MIKKILLGLLLVLLAVMVYHRELIGYGYLQAKGQANILLNTTPITDIMADKAVPDSVKNRLRLIEEIKKFGIDSLGLSPTKSYTTFFDQKGQPILWVITASEKYRLVAKEWIFPIVGSFQYKGFFDTTYAHLEEQNLIKMGYDTQQSEVSAWSTLGFFKDPILSSMLNRSDGSIANLILHEMTHATIFIKDSLQINENLASFVGDFGAEQFLKYKFGQQSEQLKKYQFQKRYREAYSDHVLRGATALDNLYRSFKPNVSTATKDTLKVRKIREIVQTADTLLGGEVRKYRQPSNELPNNAFFIGYITYRQQQNQFKDEFEKKYKRNFSTYFSILKNRYKSSF